MLSLDVLHPLISVTFLHANEGKNFKISALKIGPKNRQHISAIGWPWPLNIGIGIGYRKTHIGRSLFSSWLKPIANNCYQVYCTPCKKALELSSLGIQSLQSHAKSEKHKVDVKGLQLVQAISQFCSAPSLTLPGRGIPFVSHPVPHTVVSVDWLTLESNAIK